MSCIDSMVNNAGTGDLLLDNKKLDLMSCMDSMVNNAGTGDLLRRGMGPGLQCRQSSLLAIKIFGFTPAGC